MLADLHRTKSITCQYVEIDPYQPPWQFTAVPCFYVFGKEYMQTRQPFACGPLQVQTLLDLNHGLFHPWLGAVEAAYDVPLETKCGRRKTNV